jgi:hypothetical protein
MIRIIAAGSVGWLLAGAMLLLPGMASVAPIVTTAPVATTAPMATIAPVAHTGTMSTVPNASAAPAGAMTVNSLAKGDRLDIRSFGPSCSQRGWPYYEASCIRTANAANHDAKPIRVIAIDRLPPGIELAAPR